MTYLSRYSNFPHCFIDFTSAHAELGQVGKLSISVIMLNVLVNFDKNKGFFFVH